MESPNINRTITNGKIPLAWATIGRAIVVLHIRVLFGNKTKYVAIFSYANGERGAL